MKSCFPVIALLALLLAAAPGPADADCRAVSALGRSALACTFDAATDQIVMGHADQAGVPYSRLPPFVDAMAAAGTPVRFAMNAGMYDRSFRPVGLYVEAGETKANANTRDGPGNFHLLPNGVFYVAGDRAGVMETNAFLASGIAADYATQSGPLIVSDGVFHPRLLKDSRSARIRNGVGVKADGRTVVFAVSTERVTFWEFATLFRDVLDCPDALYLDGTVSSVYAPDVGRYDRIYPVGPIVAVKE